MQSEIKYQEENEWYWDTKLSKYRETEFKH